jgi:hypothetical protein
MRTLYFPGENTPMAYSFSRQEAEDVGYVNSRSGNSTEWERYVVALHVSRVLVPATVDIQAGRKPEDSLVVYTADPKLEGRDIAYIRDNLQNFDAIGSYSDPRHRRIKTMLANAEGSVLGITRSEIGSMEALPAVVEQAISGGLNEQMSQSSLVPVRQSRSVE